MTHSVRGAQRPEQVKVTLRGETFTWTGSRWYDELFLTPPTNLVRELNILLEATIAEDDDAVQDTAELLRRASEARENQQYDRAERLARRVMATGVDSHAGAAVLCATLRDKGMARQALAETERFSRTNNQALLTSRAAALCDLRRWPEAKRVIARALAIGGSEHAFLVVNRIKKECPGLYK